MLFAHSSTGLIRLGQGEFPCRQYRSFNQIFGDGEIAFDFHYRGFSIFPTDCHSHHSLWELYSKTRAPTHELFIAIQIRFLLGYIVVALFWIFLPSLFFAHRIPMTTFDFIAATAKITIAQTMKFSHQTELKPKSPTKKLKSRLVNEREITIYIYVHCTWKMKWTEHPNWKGQTSLTSELSKALTLKQMLIFMRAKMKTQINICSWRWHKKLCSSQYCDMGNGKETGGRTSHQCRLVSFLFYFSVVFSCELCVVVYFTTRREREREEYIYFVPLAYEIKGKKETKLKKIEYICSFWPYIWTNAGVEPFLHMQT